MYNLNINVATSNGNLLAVENSCTTPKTPEILNSLMAMTNPFEGYSSASLPDRAGSGPRLAACPPGFNENSCSSGSSSGSPLNSPVSSTNPPPSVQHTCSQLIKEGLKLTIQTKRRNTGQSLDGVPDDLGLLKGTKMARREEVCHDDDYDDLFSPGDGLTAEDEERRRRRRERNKIAATKCRLKKRERTVNLVQESEILETQNHDLKSQIQELETQRRRLMDMLSMHTPTCMKNNSGPSVYCGDSSTGPQTYCESTNVAHNYHHFSSNSCNFNGGYSSSGVDSGCMA